MSRQFDAKQVALKAYPNDRKAGVRLLLDYLEASEKDFIYGEGMTPDEYIYGPVQKPIRLITVTISLPDGGTFEDYVLALKTARQVQIDAGNPAAAQAISVALALAEAGKIALETSTTAQTFPRS